MEKFINFSAFIRYLLTMRKWLNAAQILLEAADDIFAYMCFPVEYWKRIYSNHMQMPAVSHLHRTQVLSNNGCYYLRAVG